MGILSRFAKIMESNINDLLDKCEDPSKMIDQTLRDLQKDLAEVKKETATVMAEEKRCQRVVDEAQAEVDKYVDLATKAVQAGNDEDAKKFLAEKGKAQSRLDSAKTAYDGAKVNADKMKQMHDKLVSDIDELDKRKDAIKAKVSVAKAQERVNKMTSSVNSEASISAFERMEAKADAMLDKANAEAELNSDAGNPMKQLEEKYASGSDADVDAELAALKAQLGK